jgi:mannan endo-1,4-beta-mannosidase
MFISLAIRYDHVKQWIEDSHHIVGKPFVMGEYNTHRNHEVYWQAMFQAMEDFGGNGDLFWCYHSTRGSSGLDVLHGDGILEHTYKPHQYRMKSRNL